MDLPQNPFKRALKAGKAQIGLWSTLKSSAFAAGCAMKTTDRSRR